MPQPQTTPLFVRLAQSDAQLLDDVSVASGRSKRQLVGEAVREHLGREQDQGLTVGRIELRDPPAAVLTLEEAAVMLKVSDEQLLEAAVSGEVPARRIGDQWRFSHDALLAWLGLGTAAQLARPALEP